MPSQIFKDFNTSVIHAISKAIVEQIYNRTHPNIKLDQQSLVDGLKLASLKNDLAYGRG